MDYGTFLKEERVKKSLSIQALADKAGVTSRAIYYWENGKRSMSLESADKIFKALDVSVVIGKGGNSVWQR